MRVKNAEGDSEAGGRALAEQQSKRDEDEDMSGGKERMKNTVHELSTLGEAGVSLSHRWPKQEEKQQGTETERRKCALAHIQRKWNRNPNPIQAITAPPTRTVIFPQGHFTSKPRAMPLRCSNPVAKTKPTE